MLQGAIVWTSMLAADSLSAAKECEGRFSDSRVKHYWDPDRILGRYLSRTLNLKASIAWDVYLVYTPVHAWDTDLPPTPKFWMHQLDEEPALFLDPIRFKHNVQVMIEESF
ncbi:MAG: hypothetical protein L0287_09290 [Anaerolineae bacterium]|nr:hypothetical protein [Anaerolineae bacterium]MCI0608084.1 hypothetical protein [Anaerolineae bacterium]